MKIMIELFATFRVGRFKKEHREYQVGSTFRQVIADVGIIEAELGMALVNGRHTPMEHELSDGDSVALFPLLGGG